MVSNTCDKGVSQDALGSVCRVVLKGAVNRMPSLPSQVAGRDTHLHGVLRPVKSLEREREGASTPESHPACGITSVGA